MSARCQGQRQNISLELLRTVTISTKPSAKQFSFWKNFGNFQLGILFVFIWQRRVFIVIEGIGSLAMLPRSLIIFFSLDAIVGLPFNPQCKFNLCWAYRVQLARCGKFFFYSRIQGNPILRTNCALRRRFHWKCQKLNGVRQPSCVDTLRTPSARFRKFLTFIKAKASCDLASRGNATWHKLRSEKLFHVER